MARNCKTIQFFFLVLFISLLLAQAEQQLDQRTSSKPNQDAEGSDHTKQDQAMPYGGVPESANKRKSEIKDHVPSNRHLDGDFDNLVNPSRVRAANSYYSFRKKPASTTHGGAVINTKTSNLYYPHHVQTPAHFGKGSLVGKGYGKGEGKGAKGKGFDTGGKGYGKGDGKGAKGNVFYVVGKGYGKGEGKGAKGKGFNQDGKGYGKGVGKGAKGDGFYKGGKGYAYGKKGFYHKGKGY